MERRETAVVSDVPELTKSLEQALSTAGHRVTVFDAESLHDARLAQLDAIVLAAQVDDTSAPTRCRLIRGRDYRAALVVCVRSYDAWHETAVLDSGADDYWVWSSDPAPLLARLRACCRRAVEPSVTVSFGDLELVPNDACVRGAACGLTRRELSLLRLLASYRGGIVSRDAILKTWGLRVASGSNFIDVHVARLRRKLGSSSWQLQTVRGRGLRLIQPLAVDTNVFEEAPASSTA
jgi:DNA-binding response OmpR family regulator